MVTGANNRVFCWDTHAELQITVLILKKYWYFSTSELPQTRAMSALTVTWNDDVSSSETHFIPITNGRNAITGLLKRIRKD